MNGLVAVVDALGAKLFSQSEADKFLEFRDSIARFNLAVLETHSVALDLRRMRTFTIGDTIVYVYEPPGDISYAEVERFCHVLRITVSHSINSQFPLRGAFAVGEFYRDGETTVLGPAVSDAASWFEAADWIGVIATPRTSLFIQGFLESAPGAEMNHVLVDYPVPMKDKRIERLKAVNWPKAYFVSGLRPAGNGTARGLVMSAFAKRQIPPGTESKYANAMTFFDAIEEGQDLENQFGAQPSPAPPEDDESDSPAVAHSTSDPVTQTPGEVR
jgi:hypothetical protein